MLPVLLSILNLYSDVSHENVVALTLLLLAILSHNKDANQLYMRRENAGAVILNLLNFPTNYIKSRAALALASYSVNNTIIKKECGSAVKRLLQLLTENTSDEQLKMSVCAALTSLVDGRKSIQKKLQKKKRLVTILQLIASNQIPPKYALNLVAALAHKNSSIQDDIRVTYKGLFRKIVRLLSPFTKPKIIQCAVHALLELSRRNKANQRQIAKAGAVPFLVNILSSKTPQDHDLIAGALYLCWVCSRFLPNKLNDAEFRTNKGGGIKEVLNPLREIQNDHVKKIIAQMDLKLNR